VRLKKKERRGTGKTPAEEPIGGTSAKKLELLWGSPMRYTPKNVGRDEKRKWQQKDRSSDWSWRVSKSVTRKGVMRISECLLTEEQKGEGLCRLEETTRT